MSQGEKLKSPSLLIDRQDKILGKVRTGFHLISTLHFSVC